MQYGFQNVRQRSCDYLYYYWFKWMFYILATFCESFTAIGWMVPVIFCVEPIYPQYSWVLETCLALRYWFFEVLGSESFIAGEKYCRMLPSQHTESAHYQPTRETSFKGCFSGGPIVAWCVSSAVELTLTVDTVFWSKCTKLPASIQSLLTISPLEKHHLNGVSLVGK